MIDKNGKLFSKISIVDILIVLAIILCIAAAFIRFSGLLGDNQTTPVNFEYVVKIQQIREKSAEAVEKKGHVYSNLSDKSYFGEIVDVKVEENENTTIMYDGTVKKTHVPDRYDVYATIRTNGKSTGTALYTSGGKKIEIGSYEYIATKWVAAGAEIVSINILD